MKGVTIDCTPTWSGILPWLAALLKQGGKGEAEAMKHLAHMARVADQYVEFVKGTEREPGEDPDPPEP